LSFFKSPAGIVKDRRSCHLAWKLHFKGQKYTRKTRFTDYIVYVADKSTALVNENKSKTE